MKANISSSIKKFKLNSEQIELYTWLKSQNLNTDDNTLCYWTKKYPSKRIKEVVNFAKKRIRMGQAIQNQGGWINSFLKSQNMVVNETSNANLAYLEEFIRNKKWVDIKIYEKYIVNIVTGDDLPLTLESEEFQRSLEALYNKSQLYK